MDKASSNISFLPNAESGSEDISYRQLPAHYEAEQGLLGAIMINNNSYERVSMFLEADHFAEPVHGRIYGAIQKLVDRGQMANPVTLKSFFEDDEALASVGGAKYLAKLAAAVVTTINVEDYGKLIHEAALRRQLINIGDDVVNTAYKSDIDITAHKQIETAEQRLYDLATNDQVDNSFQSFEKSLTIAIEYAEAAYKRDGQLSGVSSGLRDLDQLLGGLHNSDLIILAGRPSMGKTALATNMAFHAAKHFKPKADNPKEAEDGGIVAFFSLEMSAEQLATRILAEESGISSEKIRRGLLSHDDFQNVVMTSQDLSRAPLYIDDTPALSVSGLRTRARRLKRQKGLSLIIVDYLQLMQGSGNRASDNRVQELSEITRGLKTLAKELDVPVIALSQLSRQVENREDKRPQLADLRESGSIEQDADVVMFVFREAYYLARSEPMRSGTEDESKFNEKHARWQELIEKKSNMAEVIVAKQRHGPIGKVELVFDGNTTRFKDYTPAENLPDVIGS